METPENKQVNLKYSKDFMILALLVGLVMLTAHVYDMAPALIPTHFGLNLSSPMGYGPKSSLLVVAVTVLFILLFAWLLYSAVNASFKIRRMR